MSVYFIRHKHLIKIGFSSNLPFRVAAILSAVPGGEAVFLGHFPAGRETETHLHGRFSASRFNGEWFVESNELLQLIGLIADSTLPEKPKVTPKALRADSESDVARASVQLRFAAAHLWPERNHAERKSSLAELLGWTRRRVRSIYEASVAARLSNSEMQQITRLLAPKAGVTEHDKGDDNVSGF